MPATSDIAAQIAVIARTSDTTRSKPLTEGNLVIDPHELVLFPNVFKDAEHPNRADYWGRANMGDGRPLVSVGMWLKQDRYGNPVLAGSTSFHQPGKHPGMEDEPAADLAPADRDEHETSRG